MTSRELHGLRVAVFVSPGTARGLAGALRSRGGMVDCVSSAPRAIDALLSGRDELLVTDRLLPGVMMVMQPRHLVTAPFGDAFGDQFVEFLRTPVEPAALAAALRRAAARRLRDGREGRLPGGGRQAA